jgi:hypothetical protein
MQRIAPIFEYAWWCVAHSHDPGLEAAARTYFYEDLPAYTDTQDKIVPFLDLHKYRVLRASLSSRIDDQVKAHLFERFERSLASERDA